MVIILVMILSEFVYFLLEKDIWILRWLMVCFKYSFYFYLMVDLNNLFLLFKENKNCIINSEISKYFFIFIFFAKCKDIVIL